jgi:hypothetical protein
MARNSYGGDKRRREVAKKKKREAKLARKQSPARDENQPAEDTSYLEYLNPGGLPEEADSEDDDSSEDEHEEE